MNFKQLAGVLCWLGMLCAGAAAQVVYVDAAAPAGGDGNTWGGAYQSLQTALTRARTAGGVSEVRVAQGTYKPGTTGSRIVSFDLVGGVTLRGGYAGVASATPDVRDLRRTPTVLTGDVAGDDIDGGGRGVRSDNLLHVVTASNLTSTAVLDGFHIRGGQASGTGDQGQGAGVFVASCGTNFVMANCVLRDNFATGYAPALYSRYTIGVIVNCLVVGNRTNVGNSGGGVSGMVVDYSSMPGVPTLDHCTVAYNTGWVDSAGCQVSGGGGPSFALVRGCVFFGNTSAFVNTNGQQIVGQYAADSSIASAGGNWLGTGTNKTGDPLFIDPAGPDGVVGTLDDDFRLRTDSPCIDCGGSVVADVADVDGDGDRTEPTPLDADGAPRVYDLPGVPGSGADMGAIEGPALSAQPSTFALSVLERGQSPLSVALSKAVSVPVTVTLAGAGLTVTPSTLTFLPGNWDVPQSVSVYGLSDADFVNTVRPLRLSGSGLSTAVVTVTVVDADTSPTMVLVNPQGTLPPDGFTWASGFRTIDAALAAADVWPAATQIWIKEGTYVPATAGWSNPQDARIQVRGGLTLMGGFAGTETLASQRDGTHPTVISGDIQHDDVEPWFDATWYNNTMFLIEFTSAEGETGLDGLTLRGARDVALLPNYAGVPAGVANNLRLRNCRFEKNYQGGVAWFTRGLFEATGCVFESNGVNSPSRWPLRVQGDPRNGVLPSIRLVGCTFRNNRGKSGGASLEMGVMEVIGGVFEHNTGTDGAEPQGALVMKLGNYNGTALSSSASVTGARFEQNAGGYGAGLNFYRSISSSPTAMLVTSVSGCDFVGNTATSSPAIFNSGSAPAAQTQTTITGCLFDGNIALGDGGAVNGGRYDSCTFRNNQAAYGGGAANAQLEDCLIENNSATMQGGGVYRGSVLRCTVRGNSAPEGGGMADSFSTGSVVSARSTLFEGNHAFSPAAAGGGGAYGVHAVDCAFIGNTSAADGGGGQVNAYRCRFAGNTAARNGGGAYASRLVSCLLTGNSATGRGGGCSDCEVVTNCTVAGNSAATVGGAAEVSYAENSILWGNTSAGTLEAKQISVKANVTTTSSGELQLGRLVTVGQPVSGCFNLPGPMTGGFVGPFDPVLLSTATSATPGMMPSYSVTPPVGHLTALVVGGVTKESRWVSTQGAGASTNGPSALYFLTNMSISPFEAIASARIEATYAADGQLGDATHSGIYLNGVGLPGSGGGSPTVQTSRVLDVSDLIGPGQNGKVWFYNRNDAGFNGILAYVKTVVSRPQVSSCTVQGLSVFAGNGNLGLDPLFVNLAGPDGLVGTVDDDGSLQESSSALDSGNGRLVAVDKLDFDADGDRTERMLEDLLGHARVVDLPSVPDTGVGVLGVVDRGAVERVAVVCPADVGGPGGLPGADGVLNNNDFIVYIDMFFAADPRADVGSTGGVPGADGAFDNNDFIVFIDRFFAGC